MNDYRIDRLTRMQSRLIKEIGVGTKGYPDERGSDQEACVLLIKHGGEEEIYPLPTLSRALTVYGGIVTSYTPGKSFFMLLGKRMSPDRDATWRWFEDGP